MRDESAHAVAVLHLAATLFMVGVIWFVQVVHYPLFARVGPPGFAAYERSHARRTGWVVAPPMLAELVTAFLLLWVRPAGVPLWAAAAGLALVAVNWGSTWAVQVPCHDRSSRGGRLSSRLGAPAHLGNRVGSASARAPAHLGKGVRWAWHDSPLQESRAASRDRTRLRPGTAPPRGLQPACRPGA